MTSSTAETLHFLDSADGPRFAVRTEPAEPISDTGVLLCNGGWVSGSWYFNRLYVKLARSLADRGHPVVRFDWYGTGESPGFLLRFNLEDPFVEDVVGAASLLKGCRRTVGIGYCFGAVSLLAAAERLEHLAGLVLISPSLAGRIQRARATQLKTRTALRASLRPSVVRGWFDPNMRRLYWKWLRGRGRALLPRLRHAAEEPPVDTMAMRLNELALRGVSVVLVYGEGDSNLQAFSREPLSSIVELENVRFEVVPGDVEGSATLEIQETISQIMSAAVEVHVPRDS
jgi:pimeloyl-ACP methyl ester carboxylesterase